MCTFALIVYYCIARLNRSLAQFIQRFHHHSYCCCCMDP